VGIAQLPSLLLCWPQASGRLTPPSTLSRSTLTVRQITWLHAVYGLGAAAGPLLCVATTPMFPLLTLTTPERVGAGWTDRAIGLESAVSAPDQQPCRR